MVLCAMTSFLPMPLRLTEEECTVLRLSGPLKEQYAKVSHSSSPETGHVIQSRVSLIGAWLGLSATVRPFFIQGEASSGYDSMGGGEKRPGPQLLLLPGLPAGCHDASMGGV